MNKFKCKLFKKKGVCERGENCKWKEGHQECILYQQGVCPNSYITTAADCWYYHNP